MPITLFFPLDEFDIPQNCTNVRSLVQQVLNEWGELLGLPTVFSTDRNMVLFRIYQDESLWIEEKEEELEFAA